MTIKLYKKEGKNRWISTKESKFDNQVDIIKIRSKKTPYIVLINDSNQKNYKTKSQALKFAKSYMRKH